MHKRKLCQIYYDNGPKSTPTNWITYVIVPQFLGWMRWVTTTVCHWYRHQCHSHLKSWMILFNFSQIIIFFFIPRKELLEPNKRSKRKISQLQSNKKFDWVSFLFFLFLFGSSLFRFAKLNRTIPFRHLKMIFFLLLNENSANDCKQTRKGRKEEKKNLLNEE